MDETITALERINAREAARSARIARRPQISAIAMATLRFIATNSEGERGYALRNLKVVNARSLTALIERGLVEHIIGDESGSRVRITAAGASVLS